MNTGILKYKKRRPKTAHMLSDYIKSFRKHAISKLTSFLVDRLLDRTMIARRKPWTKGSHPLDVVLVE